MKKNYKAVMVAALVFLVMIITSCDGLFTRTMTPSAARDPELAAQKIASKNSKDLVVDAGNVENKEQATTIVTALSQKAENDPDFAQNLSSEEKKQVITAATTAVIDMAAIGSKIGDIMGMVPGDDGDGDDGGEPDEEQMREIAGSIFESFGHADTYCVEAILNDAVDADGNLSPKYANDPDMQKSLAMGALAVAASNLSASGKSSDDVIDMFMGTSDDSGSGNGGEGMPPELEGAFNTFSALMEAGFDPSSLFSFGGNSDGNNDDSGSGNDD